MVELKNIPTEQLVLELISRDCVKSYQCNLYQENYRAQIYKAYSEGDARKCEELPSDCIVVVVECETAVKASDSDTADSVPTLN